MKKLAIIIFTIILLASVTGCSDKVESIEGYWMQENGDTVSFNSDGKAIIDGLSLDYSIYNDNNLSISFLGFAKEYRFNVKNDILTLTDLSSNETWTFYRDEKKQKEIQAKLNQLAAEKIEKQRIQQEAEAQEQAAKEYEKHINSLKARINSIDTEIKDRNEYITVNKNYITEAENQIQRERERINEIENKISTMKYDPDEFVQAEIEIMRGDQEVCHGTIEVHNARIETCNAEIKRHEKAINELQSEKESIVDELNELGEY